MRIEKEIFVDNTVSLSDDKKLKKGDIFICMSSGSKEHIGKVAYINEDTNYYAGGFMGIIRTNPQYCLSKFLYFYLLTSKRFREEIKLLTQGANINNISSTINLVEIPLPSIEIQKQIVDELDEYTEIINSAQKIINNYKPSISVREGRMLTLSEIAIFNPSKTEVKELPDDTQVSFVPMATLNVFDAHFEACEKRELKDVIKGYTYFRDNDVLLAKISPCFENGKAGIAKKLNNGIGFGSTEYIVIRAKPDIVYPEWIFYNINTYDFINLGKSFMTGTAGQQRIDINYIKNYRIPVPTLKNQRKILDSIIDEKLLIDSSKKIVKIFSDKIENKIKEVWGGNL